MIELADGLSLPDDAVTQTFGILARRGAGKTYTGRKITEGLIKAGLPVCVLDPLGAWWGLRSSADGKSDGLPVTILGGDHGDVPLEETAGKVVADLMVEHPSSYVLDLSHFGSNAAQDRFATDFAERLYRAKAHHREPLHLMVDEADSFAPQRPMGGSGSLQNRMLGAMESLARRGRIRGIGMTSISQRPAVLNKNVLTQIECLIAMQVTSPQDRKALEEWVRGNADRDEANTVLDSLASLEVGEAWVWSPQWLRTLQRVKIARCETFDSSSTPEHGGTLEPTRMAPVDLDALRDRMADTIEKAKADDPKELRRQIKALTRDLTQARAERPEPETVTVEVPILDAGLVARLEEALAPVAGAVETIEKATDAVAQRLADARQAPRPVVPTAPQAAPRVPRPDPVTEGDYRPRAGAKRMLEVLARFYPGTMSQSSIAAAAKIKKTGGTFGTYWSELRRHGLVTEAGGDLWTITEAGFDIIGMTPDATPMTRDELVGMWMGKLREGARRMLAEVVASWPDPVQRDDLAERAGITITGGTFGTYLGDLRRTGLVRVDGDEVSMTTVYDDAI